MKAKQKVHRSAEFFLAAASVFLCLSLASCKSMIFNKLGDMLSGAKKDGVPIQAKGDSPNPMDAFMGEKDPTIIQESFPLIVKMYEILAMENPSHQGIQIMAGQLNVMYGNLCVQTPADRMTVDKLSEQVDEYARAKYHYLKGRKYILDVFDARWPGFSEEFLSSDSDVAKSAAQKISKDDVNAAYWAAGATLLSWSLDPLDVDALSSIAGPVALLERAAELLAFSTLPPRLILVATTTAQFFATNKRCALPKESRPEYTLLMPKVFAVLRATATDSWRRWKRRLRSIPTLTNQAALCAS